MFLPNKNNRKGRPMKIKTSVDTPATGPVTKMIRAISTLGANVKKGFADIATARPGR